MSEIWQGMNQSGVKSTGADWVNVLFGAWVIASAFALRFASNRSLRWNNVAVGLVVVLLAYLAGGRRHVRGLVVLLGGWLALSPFVFGFSTTAVTWNDVVMGVLIIIGAVLAEAMK